MDWKELGKGRSFGLEGTMGQKEPETSGNKVQDGTRRNKGLEGTRD